LSRIRYVEEMSDEEFKQELLSLWESMLLFDCCGFNDLFRFRVVREELERRGYEVAEMRKPVIRKARRSGNRRPTSLFSLKTLFF